MLLEAKKRDRGRVDACEEVQANYELAARRSCRAVWLGRSLAPERVPHVLVERLAVEVAGNDLGLALRFTITSDGVVAMLVAVLMRV